MKKTLAICIAVLMLLALCACGGGNAPIVGTWRLTDGESATYGFGVEFLSDGSMRYGLTEDVLASLGGDEVSEDDLSKVMDGLEMFMDVTYKIKSDTEMEITVSALFGLAKESTTVPYSLNGDTLQFDGATYTRVK